MSLECIIRRVFVGGDELVLTTDQMAALVARLSRPTDTDTVTLIRAYAPALRNAAKRFRFDMEDFGVVEEARAVAVYAVVEAVLRGEPVLSRLNDALGDFFAGTKPMMAVPPRTLARYRSILRTAGGNADVALQLAPSCHMSREVFLSVRAAVLHNSIDDEDTAEEVMMYKSEDAFTDVEDAMMAKIALDAMLPEQLEVCRFAYGFIDGDEHSDADVGEYLEIGKSAAQRRRTAGLARGRMALGLDGSL